MELECNENILTKIGNLSTKYEDSFVVTSSNWEIENNKCINDCISTVPLLQASDRTSLEDIVSLDTCVALRSSSSKESCKLKFKIINEQKIARIALASEASVLEFFKQSGEYATTIFAEFVDDFQQHSVYFAETIIQPPSTEATIKFTRTKNKGTTMWIYGIKLILTESLLKNSKSMFDSDVINNFLSNTNQPNYEKIEMANKFLECYNSNENNFIKDDMNTCLEKISINSNSQQFQINNSSSEIIQQNSIIKIDNAQCSASCSSQDYSDLKAYIDNKFINLEKKLLEKVECMDKKTSQKLDVILEYVKLNTNQ